MNEQTIKQKNTTKENANWPADLYLEGGDQFRGWFNSSLITATILLNNPPYKQVVAHGFVVDSKGRKMSKSLGNVINPEDIIKDFSTDVVRLWVASVDFTKEIKISIPLLQEIQGNYQKIRNTLRFLLGNLSTLNEEKNLTNNLEPIDEWILARLDNLITFSQKNYQSYNFNLIYQNFLNFCINDLSSFYFETSKDSLYCDSLLNKRRKQIITVCYYLLAGILKIITPIMPFLAEEVYKKITFKFGYFQKESVMLLPKKIDFPACKLENIKLIEEFLLLRQDVFSALEKIRHAKIIHTNTQAEILVFLENKEVNLSFSKLDLPQLLLISQIKFVDNYENMTNFYKEKNYSIKVNKTKLNKCVRCWNYKQLQEQLCGRCYEIINYPHL